MFISLGFIVIVVIIVLAVLFLRRRLTSSPAELHRLQERCEDVSTRPAGWSALLDANLPSSRAGQHIPDSAGKEPLPGTSDPPARLRAAR